MTRRAFRGAAALFTTGGVVVMALFVRALTEREIRSGLFTYGLFCLAAAVGLWRIRRWGRSVALVIAMGNIGLGALSLVAVLISREGDVVIPAVLLGGNVILGYALGRPVFNLPEDATYGASDD